MIHFDLPKEKSSIIKVIGIGGGGSNAVNHMYSQGIEGVDFIICNTDSQAITNSSVPNKVQLGPHLTQGLGAGANPQIGKQATEESFEEIKKILEVNTKMAFITAGMGGGTGTGGAPIIAKICNELGILTVGIITTPFSYEGKKRLQQAEEGINTLKDYVDTLLIISNDKLRQQFGNLPFKAAFAKADNILATAAKCITDVINQHGYMNVDFADVCTAMRNGGVAILGSATAEGENRAHKAIEDALSSPLLNDNNISGAKWILLNITSSEGDYEHTIDEMDTIQAYVQHEAGQDCDVILGVGYDNTLGAKLGVTIIATGFEQKSIQIEKVGPESSGEEPKIVMELGKANEESKMYNQGLFSFAEPEDVMAPTLSENPSSLPAVSEIPVPAAPEKEKEEELRFELKIAPAENEAAITPVAANIPLKEAPVPQHHDHTYSGGYLSRPATIYTEPSGGNDMAQNKQPTDNRQHIPEMKLVIKAEGTTEPAPMQEQPEPEQKTVSVINIEETEEQKRKAADRLVRLRNMSFNVKNLDNQQELEAVPAYIRRNIDLEEGKGSQDAFYSNITVTPPKPNIQSEISTINTFLDGRKPD